MYEHRTEPLLPWNRFLKRVAVALAIAFTILGFALLVGTFGYRYFAELDWIDALLNASMILAGMGPIAEMTDTPAKLFATFYALFSGVVFLSGVGILMSPLLHRILHHFHLEGGREE
jgi:hypothetical protein